MFGLGGLLNRWGWDVAGDDYYDEYADDLMTEHQEETGCPNGIDHFEEYPDSYFCAWCGDEL